MPELRSPYETEFRLAVAEIRDICRKIQGDLHTSGGENGDLANMLAGAKNAKGIAERALSRAVKAERELDRFKRRPLHMVDPMQHNNPDASIKC